MAIAGMPGGNHTVEDIDATLHSRDDVFRATHSHEVARTIGRHLREAMLEHPQAHLFRLSYRQAAQRKARPGPAQ